MAELRAVHSDQCGATTAEPEDETKENKSLHPSEYTVGWVCTLSMELIAAKAMLEEIHAPLVCQPRADKNYYTLGRIRKHNVVLACPPTQTPGTLSAQVAGNSMQKTFPQLKFGLVVETGGGVPTATNDIRLRIICVSKPDGGNSGLVEYDRGEMQVDGFHRNRTINKPPQILLNAITTQRVGRGIGKHITEIVNKVPFKKYDNNENEWTYPQEASDVLFEATMAGNTEKAVQRDNRKSYNPRVFFGHIGSGNTVIKDGLERDCIAAREGIICLEVGTAGVVSDNLQCLVIRGVCNYADSHNNGE